MTTQDLALPPELALAEEPFDLEELDQLAFEHEGTEHSAARWRVEDDGAAEWALRHLAASRGDIAAVEEQAAEWIRQISEWARQRIAPLEHREAFFKAHLEDYALRRREASGGEMKSLVLPSGRVTTTATKPKVVVADDEAWEAWARAHPDDEMVRVKYAADAAGIKARTLITEGELVRRLAVLSCGHDLWFDEDEDVNVGDFAPCEIATCDDPISGPSSKLVKHVEEHPYTVVTVRDADTGEALAWAEVKPGSTTASVKVG